MKRLLIFALVVVSVLGQECVKADTIQGISIDFVNIGNAGNSADTTGYGAVGYDYRIGKYEISATQWQTINTAAGIGDLGYWNGDQPVAEISWYKVAQFCNYLTSGDRSKGAYQFSGNNANPGDFLGIDRLTAKMVYSTIYFLPNENEWYKAAYYKPDGSGYSLYANGTDIAPVVGVETNYGEMNEPWNIGMGTQEQNDTFDMMGNVDEWTETFVGSTCIIRGGSGGIDYSYEIRSSYRGIPTPDWESAWLGFRVASIPEPATLALLSLGGLMLRKRKI